MFLYRDSRVGIIEEGEIKASNALPEILRDTGKKRITVSSCLEIPSTVVLGNINLLVAFIPSSPVLSIAPSQAAAVLGSGFVLLNCV